MSTITQLQTPAFNQDTPAVPHQTSTTATVTRQSTSTRLDASIQTAEGDRVTLTLESEAESDRVELPRARAGAQSAEGQVTISIDGELSRTEMKHVEKALHTFQKVTKDVLYGLVVSAVAHVRRLEKLDSLADVEGSLQAKETLESTTFDVTV
jgi:hypothetical protein